MEIETDANLIGEVHCLNCGRTLAEVVRNPLSGKLRMRPSRLQSQIMVSLVGQRLLRCNRCQGKAFIEPVSQSELVIGTRRPDSIQPLVGAA